MPIHLSEPCQACHKPGKIVRVNLIACNTRGCPNFCRPHTFAEWRGVQKYATPTSPSGNACQTIVKVLTHNRPVAEAGPDVRPHLDEIYARRQQLQEANPTRNSSFQRYQLLQQACQEWLETFLDIQRPIDLSPITVPTCPCEDFDLCPRKTITLVPTWQPAATGGTYVLDCPRWGITAYGSDRHILVQDLAEEIQVSWREYVTSAEPMTDSAVQVAKNLEEDFIAVK